MGFFDDVKDFFSGGRHSEVQKLVEELSEDERKYNERVLVLDNEKFKTIKCIEDQSFYKIRTVELLWLLRENFKNTKQKYGLIFDISPKDLRRTKLNSSRLSATEIFNGTIQGCQQAAAIGLQLSANATTLHNWYVSHQPLSGNYVTGHSSVGASNGIHGTHHAIHLNHGTGLAHAKTTWVASTKSSSLMAAKGTAFGKGALFGKGAVATAAKGGALLAGKAALFTVAAPIGIFVGIGSIFTLNINLTQKIAKIKEEQWKLHKDTQNVNHIINECKIAQNEIEEKISIINMLENRIQTAFVDFDKKVHDFFEEKGFFRKLWAQFCLKLGIQTEELQVIRLAKKTLDEQLKLFKQTL